MPLISKYSRLRISLKQEKNVYNTDSSISFWFVFNVNRLRLLFDKSTLVKAAKKDSNMIGEALFILRDCRF